MSVAVVHPTGNANVRAVLRAAEGAGLLSAFWTTVAVPAGLARSPRLGRRLAGELGRRAFPEVAARHVRRRPWREGVRLAARATGWRALDAHEHGWASVDAVYHDLDRHVASRLARSDGAGVRCVYAYEDGALATFEAAGAFGVRRLYDLPIAHWRTLRRILTEERDLRPEWAPTLEGLKDSARKCERKDAEIALADEVVVASSFTRQSLREHFGDGLAVSVTPYGAPPPRRAAPTERAPHAPLEILYAGHLAQRKGLAYLVDALALLEVPWRLTLAGPAPTTVPRALRDLLADPRCRWLGHVPHATLLAEMDRAHVFVFPSLVEGFGLVLPEAMSAGLPIVTTPHTAGPDIMTDGGEGFIVPVRDAQAIADRLTRLHDDEPRRRAMGAAALARARELRWADYERRITNLLREAVG